MASSKEIVKELLALADVEINGSRPFDIQVLDDRFYNRVLEDRNLGLGEAYMDGWWNCEAIDELICRILQADLESKLNLKLKINAGLELGKSKIKSLLNPQSIARVKKDVPAHYNLGNELFTAMLDKNMAYSCGYFQDGAHEDLERAQDAKLDLVCRKLDLKPGERVLDIGCGWASFILYAAEHFGVSCDGLTLSSEQMKLGEERIKEAGLQDKVHFILEDYRLYKPEQPYDKLCSIGMLEHVGARNYPDYFKAASGFLKDNGTFLLHTIGHNITTDDADPWITKYIFPNGYIPSMAQVTSALEGYFIVDDVQNIGVHYDYTLMAWFKNFDKAWDRIQKEYPNKYDERFYRMWKYYLLSCAGAFRARDIHVWQFVLRKKPLDYNPASRSA